MHERRVQAAAKNNAAWCSAVCLAHGCPCRFIDGAWVNPGVAPPYYSNMVTTQGGAIARAHERFIRETLSVEPAREFGFKDSFSSIDPLACLDDVNAGGQRRFGLLFEASWIWREPERYAPGDGELQWRRATSEPELIEFEQVWRGDSANEAAGATPRMFPPGLLELLDMAFLVGRDAGGRAKAVAAANRTGDVVGLSNVFGPSVGASELWSGAARAASEVFDPGLPLVGYERGIDLSHAGAVGFESVGHLRVYVLGRAE